MKRRVHTLGIRALKSSENSRNLACIQHPRRMQAQIPYIIIRWLIGVKIAAK